VRAKVHQAAETAVRQLQTPQAAAAVRVEAVLQAVTVVQELFT
jgi:hypothetical protein